MGIFGKTSGTNERYSKYKRIADTAMQLVKEQAKNLDRNFEEIMTLDSPKRQSLRLSSFLAGFVGIVAENKEFPHMAGWASGARLKELSDVIQEVIIDNKYLPWDLDYHFFHNNGKKSSPQIKINLSFYQGGVIVANRIKINDDINAKFNLTIFLDTLESADGHYVDGVSNKSPKLGGTPYSESSRLKPKKTTLKNTKDSIQEDNIDDEELYLAATKEVKGKDRNEALWLKYMAINEGDEKKAKYSYINKRVAILKKEAIDKAERRRLMEEKTREEEKDKAERIRIMEEKTREEKKDKAQRRRKIEGKIREEVYVTIERNLSSISAVPKYDLLSDNLFPNSPNDHYRKKLTAQFEQKVKERLEEELN